MHDRRFAARDEGAAIALNAVADNIAGRHRDLIRVGGHGERCIDPITVLTQILSGIRGLIFQFCEAQLGRQSVFTTFAAILQQHVAPHPDHRCYRRVIEECAVINNPRQWATIRKSALFQQGGEAHDSFLARLHGRRKLVDAIVEILIFFLHHSALHLEGLHF